MNNDRSSGFGRIALLLWAWIAWFPATDAFCRQHGARTGIVVLQFDDGTEGHCTRALPILEHYGIHGSFGVVTGLLGRPGYLTPAEVGMMHDAGHEIQDHTYDHDAAMWGNPENGRLWKEHTRRSSEILKASGVETKAWNQPGGAGERYTPELRAFLDGSFDYVAGAVGLDGYQMENFHWRFMDDPFRLGYGGVEPWPVACDPDKESRRMIVQVADGYALNLVVVPLFHQLGDEDSRVDGRPALEGLRQVVAFIAANGFETMTMAQAWHAVRNRRSSFSRSAEQFPNTGFRDLDGNGRPDGYFGCGYAPSGATFAGRRAVLLHSGFHTWVYGPEPGATEFTFTMRSAGPGPVGIVPRLTFVTLDGGFQYAERPLPLPRALIGREWTTVSCRIDVPGNVDRVRVAFDIGQETGVLLGQAGWRTMEE